MTNRELALQLLREADTCDRVDDAVAFVAAALDAAEQRGAARGTQWQPIKTAPKNGTQVLLALAGSDRVNRGWWAHDPSGIGGWLMVGGQWEPTHWMPLPAPPQAASSPQGEAQ